MEKLGTKVSRLIPVEKKEMAGHFELMVLMTTWNLGNRAYGMEIMQKIEEETGRRLSTGAIYITLDRLTKKGLISSCEENAAKEHGNRPKKLFIIEEKGKKIVNNTLEMFEKFSKSEDRCLVPLA